MAEKINEVFSKLPEIMAAARARRDELRALRLDPGGLQDQLHALLEKTHGAEGHPDVIKLRAKIKALQAELAPIERGIAAATKATYVLKAE